MSKYLVLNFPGIKCLGHVIDHVPAANTEVRKQWSYASTLALCHIAHYRENLRLQWHCFMQSMQGNASEIQLPYMEIYWKIYSRWYDLKSKPGKDKNKPRGKLEVVVSFFVKAGSLTDLRKKRQSSLGQLSQLAQPVGMFAWNMSVTVT